MAATSHVRGSSSDDAVRRNIAEISGNSRGAGSRDNNTTSTTTRTARVGIHSETSRRYIQLSSLEQTTQNPKTSSIRQTLI